MKSKSNLRNKLKIQRALEKYNYRIGCYDEDIEKVSLKELTRIIDVLDYDATDVIVSIRRKKYVVEIFTVDKEVDLSIQTLDNYINQYGNNGIMEKVEEYDNEKLKELNNGIVNLKDYRV